ncbi:MAG: isoprenylcysteine carboxylmethyltransferase family protein [Gammaproteobacteria bacterium]
MRALVVQSEVCAIVLYIALAICYIPEWIGSYFQRPEKGAVKRDRGSHIFLIASLVMGIFVAFFCVNLAPPIGTIAWHQPLLFWIGIVMMLAGVAFRWYAIFVLGKYFTRDVATRTDQQVVESGPYKWIRHPSYSGALITVLGLGLALTNWVALIAVLLGAFVGYGYRVHVEERALSEALGEPYRNYMRRTRRFVPYIW